MTHSKGLNNIAGVILAGGLARRMGGGDKSLLKLGGKPMLQHVIDRARPQVGALVLNANGDPARFSEYGLPVVADVVPDFAGPLAGILTGMYWVREHQPDCQWLVSFASDTPLFPLDLVNRFIETVNQTGDPLACAMTAGREHPVFGLWSMSLLDDLQRAVVDEDLRKIMRWTSRHGCSAVEFSAQPFDPFFNINRPEELEEAEQLLAKTEQS